MQPQVGTELIYCLRRSVRVAGIKIALARKLIVFIKSGKYKYFHSTKMVKTDGNQGKVCPKMHFSQKRYQRFPMCYKP